MTEHDELVHYAVVEGLATITLDSPHNRNALSRQLMNELFQRLDEAGSFRISAPGKPTFELWIEAEGQGFVSATFTEGERAVPLPGTYGRTKKDPACWKSDATETEICAW